MNLYGMNVVVVCLSVLIMTRAVSSQGDAEEEDVDVGEDGEEYTYDEDEYEDGFPSMTAPSQVVHIGLTVLVNDVSELRTKTMDFDVDLTFAMTSIINETICPNYYANMTKAYQAELPDYDASTFINARTPIVSEQVAASYFFPDIFVTEATNVVYPSQVLPLYSTEYFEFYDSYPCYPFYKIRRRMTISCSMQFAAFPLDEQICNLTVSSFTYNANVLRLYWNNSFDGPDSACTDVPKRSYGSLFANPRIRLSEFYLDISEGSYTSTSTINGFPICGVTMQFTFRRNLLNQLLGAILPSFLLVYVSFGVFLIPSEARTERVTLSITAFLTLVTIYSWTKASVPHSGQITYADIWMIACLSAVLLVTMECCLVEQLNTSEAEFEARRKRRELDLRVKEDLFRYVQRFDRNMPTRQNPAIRGQPDYGRPPSNIFRNVRDRTDQRDLAQAMAGMLAYVQKIVPWYRLPWTADRIELWARRAIVGGFTLFTVYFWIYVTWGKRIA